MPLPPLETGVVPSLPTPILLSASMLELAPPPKIWIPFSLFPAMILFEIILPVIGLSVLLNCTPGMVLRSPSLLRGGTLHQPIGHAPFAGISTDIIV